MKDDIQQERILAVRRLRDGEKPESICASLGRSKSWLYKWNERFADDDGSWSESLSRQPLTVASRTPKEVEEIVKLTRLNLFTTRTSSVAPKLFYGNLKTLVSGHFLQREPSTAFSVATD